MIARHVLVIGAQRCGTTWLLEALAAHPDIAAAQPARPEPKVFVSDERSARGRGWYERTYFAHAGDEPIRAEKSTSYLEDPAAAERAVQVLGDPLVLVQLRDPIHRAVSHWAFSTENGFETRPLIHVLEANLDGPLPWSGEGASVSPYAYLERGRYAGYLRPWLERFGDELRVLFFEELVGRPDRLGEVYRWLGVAGDVPTGGLERRVNSRGTPSPDLPAELIARLRDYYAHSDRELAQLLGRPLPWPTVHRGHL